MGILNRKFFKAYSVKTPSGTFYLHEIVGSRYYFSKKVGKNAVSAMPGGWKLVSKTAKLPMLKRA